MNDKLDHFVLEYDGESGIALLAMTEGDGSRIADGAGLPYALARGTTRMHAPGSRSSPSTT